MILHRTFQDGGLTLRPIDPERDAPALYELFLDERMHRFTGNRVPEDVDEIRRLLTGYAEHPGIWAWSIRDGETFIGTYWLGIPRECEGKRIISGDAQRIGVPFWRMGYAKRCRNLLYRFAFEELGVEEIHSDAWAENENSCNAMTRYGFVLERRSESFNRKYGRVMTGNEYVLTRDRFRRLYG